MYSPSEDGGTKEHINLASKQFPCPEYVTNTYTHIIYNKKVEHAIHTQIASTNEQKYDHKHPPTPKSHTTNTYALI